MMRAALAAALLALPAADNPVDRHLGALWREHGVSPAPRTGDAEFLRRASLDLTGTVPSEEDAARPPADRARLVDALLASDAFAAHWADRLGHSLLGYPRDLEDHRINRPQLHGWLRARLAADAGWDAIVRGLLTATGDFGADAPVSFINQFTAFIKDAPVLRPEDVTAKACEEFLGIRLRCAQCHDHPFDRWTQADFLAMTAFWRRTGFGAARTLERADKPFAYEVERAPLPGPRFLDGAAGRDDPADLADRVVAHPQFARVFVNRVWACLFGRGLVEPWNDFSPSRRPVAPALLDELAAAWRRENFRVRWLMRTVVLSEAYGLSSRAADAKALPLFAAARVRPLAPEQLYGAIARATRLAGAPIDVDRLRRLAGAQAHLPHDPHDALRAWFLRMSVQTSSPESPHAPSRLTANSLHAVHMMIVDSPLYDGARARLKELAGRPPAEAAAELYLATLSRRPTAAELKRIAGEPLEDVFWCLLNCDEFVFNH